MEIRIDIFSELGWFYSSREVELDIWVKEAYQPFNTHFSTLDKFISFINDIEKTEDAERFIRLCQFYNSSKNYVKHSFTKLIMMFSIIESIISLGKTYRPFKDWILGQYELIESRLTELKKIDVPIFKKIIDDLKIIYHDEYGSTRNVIDFFNDYISDDEKVNIIKSFRYKMTDYVSKYSEKLYEKIPHMIISNFNDFKEKGYHVENELMPICYNWRFCYIDYGHCHPNIFCELKEDDSLMALTLKKVINIIYSMRSDFVHNARMPPIGESGIDIVGGMFKGKPIMIELNIGEFEKIFENGFLEYFNQLKK